VVKNEHFSLYLPQSFLDREIFQTRL